MVFRFSSFVFSLRDVLRTVSNKCSWATAFTATCRLSIYCRQHSFIHQHTHTLKHIPTIRAHTHPHTRTPREVLRYCSGIVLLASFAKDSLPLLLLLTVLLLRLLPLLLVLQLCNVSGAAPAHVPHSIPCGECVACERQSLQSQWRGNFCFLLHFSTPKKYATVFCPCY